MSGSTHGPEAQPLVASPEVRRDAELLAPLDEKVMEAIFEAQIHEQREHYKDEAKKKLSKPPRGAAGAPPLAPLVPSAQAIEKKAEEMAKKELLKAAAALIRSSGGGSAPTKHEIEERARMIAEGELKASDKVKRDGALAVATILLNSPSSKPEQVAEALVSFGKLHSLRGGHVKDEARIELVSLLNANTRHRKLIEKTIVERQEVFDALADVLVLFSMSEIGAINTLALRDKITAHEQAGALAAAKKATEAKGSPEEIKKAAEYATKRADRLTNVLGAIARKDASVGASEIFNGDFWRLQGRGILNFLNANPKIKGLAKFGGYALVGAGGLTIIGGIIVGAIAAALLAGAGVIGTGVFGQVFSGGWKKPAGKGGGGGGGGGGGH